MFCDFRAVQNSRSLTVSLSVHDDRRPTGAMSGRISKHIVADGLFTDSGDNTRGGSEGVGSSQESSEIKELHCLFATFQGCGADVGRRVLFFARCCPSNPITHVTAYGRATSVFRVEVEGRILYPYAGFFRYLSALVIAADVTASDVGSIFCVRTLFASLKR